MTGTTTQRSSVAPDHGGTTDPHLSTLIVDACPAVREFVQFALSEHFGAVQATSSLAQAEAVLASDVPDLLLVNTRLPDGSGIDWIRERRGHGDRTPAVFIAEHDELPDSPDIAGTEWLPVPFSVDQMLAAARRATDRSSAIGATPHPPAVDVAGRHTQHRIVALDSLLAMIDRVARGTSTILLEGESGTGKEVIARCIHDFSERRGPFVPINCSSISPDLLESELFGHVRGAFTGASEAREGVFSHARGGTLLLDEIAEMPFGMQAKLLRVLEEHTVRPVGSDREQSVDVRVIAATNRSIHDEVAAGTFREDLFHRLNVVPIRLPPLRERPADIAPLVRVFSEAFSRQLNLPPLSPSAADLHALKQYDWPGNIRELKNLVERTMLLGGSLAECLAGDRGDSAIASNGNGGYPVDLPLTDVERLHMLKVLDATGGNKSEAARRLGVSRKTVERKLRQWTGDSG